ncbi:MAG: choice-of-anchor D domain-containing protein [Bacteriovoracaceae bacterium]|nr:choice-of-anchor D domain-containing protein [Bacteriovoracaceae bacterium]
MFKSLALTLLTLVFTLTSCKPTLQVAQIEAGVEAELNSKDGFVLNFGEKIISGSYIGVATLSNLGKFAITGLAATPLDSKSSLTYLGGTFPGTNGTCSSTIASGSQCTIEFEFKPESEGNYNYNIALDFNTGVTSRQKILKVIAYAGSAAFLKFSDDSDFDFGIHEVNEKIEKTFTIKNNGGLTAKNLQNFIIEAPFSYKGGSYPGLGGTCGLNIIAYASCTIVVEMNATVNETALKVIGIDYFNGNGNITMSGSFQALIVSIEADVVVLASGAQDFGSAAFLKGLAKKFKIMNKGYKDATSLVFSGSANFVIGTNTCNGVIEKSKFCEFNVLFSPTISGDILEDFIISYDSGKQVNTISLSVKGKGIAPAKLTFDLLNVNDFGNQGINSEKILSFLVKNTGDFTASSVVLTSSSTDFLVDSSTCLSIMLKGSSCILKIKFNPTSAGVKSGNLVFTYNNGSGSTTSTQALTGSASALAYLKYTDAHPLTGYDFGVTPVNKAKSARMLVKNTGLADATNVYGDKLYLTDFYYSGDFNLSTRGKVISDYPLCFGGVHPGRVCRGFNDVSSQMELYYNDNSSTENFNSLQVYSVCTPNINTLCQLSTVGSNPGIHVFPGERVLLDYPVCEATIPVGQTCQVVFEYNPISSGAITSDYYLNYVNDNLFQSDNQKTVINFSAQEVANLSYQVEATSVPNIVTGYQIPSAYNIGEKITRTVTITNNGQYSAYINSIDWNDPTQRNFSFDSVVRPSFAPGLNELNALGSCLPSSYLSGGQSCTLEIWFVPQDSGNPLSDILKIDFNDGDVNKLDQLTIKAVSAGLAQFQFSPIISPLTTGFNGINFPAVPLQLQTPSVNYVDRQIIINNIGNGDLTISNLASDVKFCKGLVRYAYTSCVDGDFEEGQINSSTPTSCLNSVTNPAESCTLDIQYSPTIVRSSNYFTIMMTYTSSGLTVKKYIYGKLDSADPAILKFTDGGALGTNAYDFKLREYQETFNADLQIENTSGVVGISNISFVIEDDSASVFSYDSINSTCTNSLIASGVCNVRVDFTPNAIGLFTATLKANYFNGKENVSVSIPLKGTGEPPLSVHKGWSKIIAIGNKVNKLNVSDNNHFVELEWNNMEPKSGYSITGYNIYRRLGDGYYGGGDAQDDYTTPVNLAPIATSLRKFVDTTVVSGKVYYYEVRPIVLGFPSRTLESSREVRIATPFDNMVLVHRWMANSIICQKLGKQTEISSNNRCSFAGIGSKNNYYDIGYDLMVDRYELGSDKSSRPDQLPLKDTQSNVLMACDAQGDFTLFNFNKTTSSKSIRKRILSRKEYQAAAAWPSTNTDSVIAAKEVGLTSSSSCNGANGSTVENTGNNSLCKSFFGIEDAVGNELEWVSDRIINGVGVTDQMNVDAGYDLRLDTTNKDLAGVDFNNLIPAVAPNLFMKDAPCFTVPLGLSLPLNPETSTCLNSKVTSTLGASYFHDDLYSVSGYSDMKGLTAGGVSYINGTSGVYSSFWLGVTTAVGSRCAMKLDN